MRENRRLSSKVSGFLAEPLGLGGREKLFQHKFLTNNMKRGLVILIIFFSLIFALFLIRLISPRELDDISPEIPCPELEIYKPDILYIISYFDNKPISENKIWCEKINSLNKKAEIHGISHQPYQEFLVKNISQEDLDFAMLEFEKCFNQTPDKFKPPQLKISKENKILIEENNLKLENYFNQITHKVYHCNDEGKIKNKWIKIF